MKENLDDWLVSKGWRRVENGAYNPTVSGYWWRRYPEVEPRCLCNDDKPGVQLGVWEYPHPFLANVEKDYEIELTAQANDGTWVKLRCYGLTEADLRCNLDRHAERLIRAWRAVQTNRQETTS